ncbi:COG1361 S-layer family protein [Blautia sp. Sow4_E7]|uniref:COG1361 S-layer family protein n=1 Tax=Blautia sp. Sow4_E7 TaxID=3438749 RepID=UPI003F8F8991
MREEQLQKKFVFVVKISEIIWIAASTAMILFFIFPFAVFAQETDFENTETVFEDETETAPDITAVPDSDPDLDGFISGDDSSEKDNTIHVIIENGSAGSTDNSNTDPAGDGTMTGGDTSYGDVYTGSTGGETSSSGEKILHKPQLLLEDSNLSSQTLKAGTTQEMSVTFRNKSRSQNVYGLKISLSTETKGIEFDKNSFYVQRLTPGEAITLKQNLSIAEDTEPGQVMILFSLEYEDSKATGATGTETLTFNVTQPVRAELEASDIPSVFYTMDTVEIPVKALNLGRDIIYNAKVQLEADGLSPKETVFLGNIDAGTAAEGTIRIYVKGSSGAENSAGKLILTYEDSTGNPYQTAVDFTSEIKESQIQSLKVEDSQEETNSWWYSIIAVLAVLLVSIILFLLARLHKKSVLLEEARKAASH